MQEQLINLSSVFASSLDLSALIKDPDKMALNLKLKNLRITKGLSLAKYL